MVNPHLKEIMDYYKIDDEKKIKNLMADCLVAIMSCVKITEIVDDLFKDAKPEHRFKIHFCFSEMQRNSERQMQEIKIPNILKPLAQ